VSGRFVGARYTCVVGVGAQAMRPAVVEARRRDVGIGSRCTSGTLSGRGSGTGVVGATDGTKGVTLEGSGGGFLGALLVGGSEEHLEVGPGFLGGRFLVPITEIQREDSGVGKDLAVEAEERGFSDCFLAGGSDLLSKDGSKPEGFHTFRRFPRDLKRVHVLGELILVQLGVVGNQVLDQLERGDVGVAVEGILQRADVGRIDRSEELTLQGVFDFVEKGEGLEVPFVVSGGDGDLASGGVGHDVGFVTWMSRVGPVERGVIVERVVGGFAEYEDSKAVLACAQNGVDGTGVGVEFPFELANREVGRRAYDRGEFRMRKVERR